MLYGSANFNEVECPPELTHKTGCIRAADKSRRPSLGTVILIGITVPLGSLSGVVLTGWLYRRRRTRRQSLTPPKETKFDTENEACSEVSLEVSDIGITKIVETHYLELDGTCAPKRKVQAESPQILNWPFPDEKTLADLQRDYGERHVDEERQELAGHLTSELSGDTVREALQGAGGSCPTDIK